MAYSIKCPKCPDGFIHRRKSLQCRECFLKNKSPWETEEEKIKHKKKRKADWFQKNKSKIYKRVKKQQDANPEFWKERAFKYHLKRFYGISIENYNLMVEQQNNTCLICGDKTSKLHVDHNHITGKIRGLLCFNCNGGLGQFKDNLSNLKAAVRYLETHE